jgi:hypothetical protein
MNEDLIEEIDMIYDWFEDSFSEEEQEMYREIFEDNPFKFYNRWRDIV